MKAEEYLKSKGMIKPGNDKLIISGDFGAVDLAELMESFAESLIEENEKLSILLDAAKEALKERESYARDQAIGYAQFIQDYWPDYQADQCFDEWKQKGE